MARKHEEESTRLGAEETTPVPEKPKETAPEAESAKPSAATAKAAPPPVAKRPRYVAKNKRTVSLSGGAMTHIQIGCIIEEAGYGPEGIASLRAQGVELELIE